jgi:GDPmannose 4,6-dehydratase
MKKALIFGVTGQDGSYLSELLLSKDYQVIGVARRTSTPNDERIKHLYTNPNFKLVKGDVTDAMCVFRLLKEHVPVPKFKYDGRNEPYEIESSVYEIYNLAAQSHVGVSFDEPAHSTDVTYKGCLNILEAIRASGLNRFIKFYQASSSEMFGASTTLDDRATEKEFIPIHCINGVNWHGELCTTGHIQNELTPMLPNSPYAIAKLAAHHACRLYRTSYNVFTCSGILFNHESERRGIEFVTRKIARYVAKLSHYYYETNKGCTPEQAIKHVGKLPLGNLQAQRDWGHAEDYVRGMWMMLQQREPDDYVLATGQSRSVLDFLVAAFKVVHMGPDWIEKAVYQDRQFMRPCEVYFLRGDASKAKQILGWRPEISFEKLVERMVLYEVQSLNKERNYV